MRALALLLVLAWLPAVSSAAIADQVYLSADFDDEPIDQPIGTGGPELGEPVSVEPTVTAIVRSAPFDTPSLEIQDDDDFGAGAVCFEFLGSTEIIAGLAVISANVQVPEFEEGGNFKISVREQGSAALSFADLSLVPSGAVYCDDASGNLGIVGNYPEGVTFPVRLVFDMDAGTYDVWVNGTKVVEARAHGVTARGVGGVYFGCMSDPDLVGRFFVDDVLVTDFIPSPVVPATWGSLKRFLRP